MTQTNTDAAIRGISLVRRVGSVITFFVLTAILVSVTYSDISNRFRLSELKEIYARGESKMINNDVEYKTQRINYNTRITFNYKFTVGEKTYNNEYVLHSNLTQDPAVLQKIFTVHYLKNKPEKNSLNIEAEIRRVEKAKSSVIWLIIKCIGVVVLSLLFLMQIFALISEVKNVNKPIEIPAYLKKKE
jgi:hypothetical protein